MSSMSQTTTMSARTTTGKYLSASCQEIISEYFPSRTAARVVIRSNLTHPEILPSISQHLCNSVALTSSGHYADMAKVVGEYIWRCNRGPNTDAPGVRVGNMVVDHTYIIQIPPKPEGQWLEMEAVLDVPEASSGDIIDGTVSCYFRSITSQGVKLQDLAHCTVGYDWLPGWLMTWSAHAEPIKNKMDRLYARAQTETSGEVQLMYKDKAYRLFKSFVDYGPKYQNMAEVVVDTKTLEAAARHDFQPDPRNDYCGAFYIDGSCHISGFVCNTADEDVAKNAYISHGFDAMKISPKFSPGKGADIRTYVHMQALPDDKTVLGGDVYVMQDGEVVGMWEGVKFKRIPRRVLNVFLPPPRK